jgi:hypothetical protein
MVGNGPARVTPDVRPGKTGNRRWPLRATPVVIIACVLAQLAVARSAEARAARKGRAAACKASFKSSVPLKAAGQLIEARQALMSCVQSGCGAALRKQCRKQLNEVNRKIASVVLVATDDAGGPIPGVQVAMDGAPLAAYTDGRPVEVDPGEHQFVFSTDKGVLATKKVTLAPGQRNGLVAATASASQPLELGVTLPPAAPAAADAALPPPPAAPQVTDREEPAAPSRSRDVEPPHRSRVGAYLLGGLALAGFGGYGLLTYWGRQDNVALDECTPNCPLDRLDHIRKMYLAADISMAAGVVAAATSTWLFIRAGSSSPSRDMAGHLPAQRPWYVLDVTPTRAGAYATLSGAF